MVEPTLDPQIVIIKRGGRGDSSFAIYERTDPETGAVDRWRVDGRCNQCGLCVIGAAETGNYLWHDEPGRPFCVTDLRVKGGRPGFPREPRLDEPIAPGFIEAMKRMAKETETATVRGCSLSLKVLD